MLGLLVERILVNFLVVVGLVQVDREEQMRLVQVVVRHQERQILMRLNDLQVVVPLRHCASSRDEQRQALVHRVFVYRNVRVQFAVVVVKAHDQTFRKRVDALDVLRKTLVELLASHRHERNHVPFVGRKSVLRGRDEEFLLVVQLNGLHFVQLDEERVGLHLNLNI